MQMKVFKQILGVNKQTTNSGVLLEMGNDLECVKYGIKSWERIRKGRANAILLDTYNDALKHDLPWIAGVKSILEKNNLSFFYRNMFPDRYLFIYKKILTKMLDHFHEEVLHTIKSNKLRTYALFKKEPGREHYLSEIKNVKIRTQLTKFRISDHNLMIEKGRHKGLDKTKRFYPFCINKIEDEIHFSIKCPTYKNFRAPFLHSMFAEYVNVEHIPDKDLFICPMSLSSVDVPNFIHKAFELRNFLIDEPKRVD